MESDLKQSVEEYIRTNSVKLVSKAPATPQQSKPVKKPAKESSTELDERKEVSKPEIKPERTLSTEPGSPEKKVCVFSFSHVQEQDVNPWSVEAGEGGVDYDKLIRTFGSSAITPVSIAMLRVS